MAMKEGQKTTKTARREARQEELREKLQGIEYLRQIDNAVKDVVTAGYQMDANELQARKFVVDTNFKRLAKVLPDLKQTDINFEGSLGIQSHEEWLRKLS